MVYTITCLIYYCRGKLRPLSLLYIDFGATFLWMYATITMIYGVEAPTTDATIYGGADLWRCMVGDLFMAITNHGSAGGKLSVCGGNGHGSGSGL
ncbi:hypothetical protein DFP73DRAFT_584319 [Morchella snyderi]|nr:hypothetical protein DFP73DRAFT_584319 [Morchella snyderi]